MSCVCGREKKPNHEINRKWGENLESQQVQKSIAPWKEQKWKIKIQFPCLNSSLLQECILLGSGSETPWISWCGKIGVLNSFVG